MTSRSVRHIGLFCREFLFDRQGGEDSSPWQSEGDWHAFAKSGLLCAYGFVALALLLLVLLNPFGNFPETVLTQRFAHSNQRYSYPSIVRSGDYDSAIFGTSTSRLIQPASLDAQLGGHFAALSMDAASAWEQTQLTRLFLHLTPDVRTLILSLDSSIWCSPTADRDRITFRLFPASFYDDIAVNDVSDILNLEFPEVLRRSVKMMTGFQQPYFDKAGFGDFTPGEAHYDPHLARLRIGQTRAPVVPPFRGTPEQHAAYRFPALEWLSGTLAAAASHTRRLVLVRMPIHIAGQPQAGSIEADRITECQRRILAIGASRGAFVIDMAFPSDITTMDTNYWDQVHYRLPIAERIACEIVAAIRTGRSSEVLHVLNGYNPRTPG